MEEDQHKANEWIRRAGELRQQKKYDEAIDAYRQGIELMSHSPSYVSYNLIVGDMLYDMERYAEAAEAYRAIVQAIPEQDQAWTSLGLCEMKLGHYREAAEAFDRSLEIEPQSAQTLYYSAAMHAYLGHKEQAREYVQRVLRLKPEWQERMGKDTLLREFIP